MEPESFVDSLHLDDLAKQMAEQQRAKIACLQDALANNNYDIQSSRIAIKLLEHAALSLADEAALA